MNLNSYSYISELNASFFEGFSEPPGDRRCVPSRTHISSSRHRSPSARAHTEPVPRPTEAGHRRVILRRSGHWRPWRGLWPAEPRFVSALVSISIWGDCWGFHKLVSKPPCPGGASEVMKILLTPHQPRPGTGACFPRRAQSFLSRNRSPSPRGHSEPVPRRTKTGHRD